MWAYWAARVAARCGAVRHIMLIMRRDGRRPERWRQRGGGWLLGAARGRGRWRLPSTGRCGGRAAASGRSPAPRHCAHSSYAVMTGFSAPPAFKSPAAASSCDAAPQFMMAMYVLYIDACVVVM